MTLNGSYPVHRGIVIPKHGPHSSSKSTYGCNDQVSTKFVHVLYIENFKAEGLQYLWSLKKKARPSAFEDQTELGQQGVDLNQELEVMCM